MTGKPQREVAKKPVQIRIDESVYASVLPLLKSGRARFSSLSQLFETIVFLSEHIYIEEPDDGFIIQIAELKLDRIIDQIRGRAQRDKRPLHIVLDVRALSFVDMLIERYRLIFRNRSETFELLLYNIGTACDSPADASYFGNRLADVLELHPMQRGRRE